MRLKRTLVSAIAALGLSASLMAPVALAQETVGTTTATVTLGDGGTFNIEFCGALDFGSQDVTSYEGATASGVVEICYLDTESWRPGFQLQLSASNFTYSGTGTWINGTPGIPAENLTLDEMYNTYQGQWGNGFPDIGDIGAWAGNTQVTSHGAGVPYDVANNTLETQRFVAYAWDGTGTASGTLMPPSGAGLSYPSYSLVQNFDAVDGTYQNFSVDLEIPAGLPGGSYTSNLTLTFIPTPGNTAYPN